MTGGPKPDHGNPRGAQRCEWELREPYGGHYGQNIITGRSIVNDRAFCPQAEEQVSATETIRILQAVNNTLGDGFVEPVDDNTLG